VSASAKAIFPLRLGTFGLGARLGIIAICASTETLLLSFLIQQTPVMSAVRPGFMQRSTGCSGS
jgi:hypothetical protein